MLSAGHLLRADLLRSADLLQDEVPPRADLLRVDLLRFELLRWLRFRLPDLLQSEVPPRPDLPSEDLLLERLWLLRLLREVLRSGLL